MMWPATFLPFVYGLGFTPPQQKKNKCEKRTSKNDMEVDSADTETHVHDGAGSSGTGTEESGMNSMRQQVPMQQLQLPLIRQLTHLWTNILKPWHLAMRMPGPTVPSTGKG